jgi:hypothetical protein
MARLNLLGRPQPLIGVLLVIAGWSLSHQLGSNSVFDDCASRGGGWVLLVSFLGLIVTAAGGVYSLQSWTLFKGSGRGFLGLVGALLALVAGFAVVLQIAAGLILPPCAA